MIRVLYLGIQFLIQLLDVSRIVFADGRARCEPLGVGSRVKCGTGSEAGHFTHRHLRREMGTPQSRVTR